nr:TRAP transporter large permease [Acuticoccus mangrovi]
MALGAPVFIVFLAGAIATIAWVLPVPPIIIQQTVFGSLSNYALLAVPFFLFAGELMRRSGIADRLVDFAIAAVGRVPGSMGLTTIGAGTVLGAVSGSSPATVAALGKTLYPGLLRTRHSPSEAAGLIASSASVAIVIPPSIAMILYGAAAEQSIAKLFIAGVPAGLLIAGLMALWVVGVALVRGSASEHRFVAAIAVRAFLRAVPGLLMPVFVLGGIVAGWFSPTEAGGFAALYAILVGILVHRSLSLSELLEAAAEAAVLSAQILIIVAAAGVFSYLLTTQQVPQALIGWVGGLGLNAWQFLLAVNLLLLAVGCLLDPTSAILVLSPLLVPMATSLGIDPIHFGIVMTVNLAIGMFTPPFGLNVFVAQSVLGLPLGTIFRGVLPFAIVQILALAIITYWPPLTLAITRLV